jgi:hypothetical protein
MSEVILYMEKFCCDKTTEAGADEVYMLVVGNRSDGKNFAVRLPDQGHWDMNDDKNGKTDAPEGDSHCLTSKYPFGSQIEPDQTWNLNMLFMEGDGGTTKEIQQIASQVLQRIDDPYAAGAGKILSVLTQLGFKFKDTDDVLGEVGVRITNDRGQIDVEWSAKDRIVHINPAPFYRNAMRHKEIRMNGDGSNYVCWIEMRT